MSVNLIHELELTLGLILLAFTFENLVSFIYMCFFFFFFSFFSSGNSILEGCVQVKSIPLEKICAYVSQCLGHCLPLRCQSSSMCAVLLDHPGRQVSKQTLSPRLGLSSYITLLQSFQTLKTKGQVHQSCQTLEKSGGTWRTLKASFCLSLWRLACT